MLPFVCNQGRKLEYIFDLLVFAQRNPGRINEELIKVDGWCVWEWGRSMTSRDTPL